MSLYSDGSYLEQTKTWHTEDSAWKAQQILKLLQKHRLAPATVAEIGCGAGEILLNLQKALPDSTRFSGYDVSGDAIALAMRHSNERLSFHQQDLLTTRERFDLLLMIDVVEHVEDPFAFLRGCREHGRYKIYHIPLEFTVSAALRVNPLLYARQTVGHIHYFSKETALEILKDTGHRVIDWTYTAGAIELERQGMATRVANLPRRLIGMLSKDWAQRLLGGYSLLVLAE